MKRKLTLEDHGFTKTKRFKGNFKIDDFPTELLIKIFKYLSPSDRRNLSTVNQRWLNIVNNHFRSDHCIILNSETDYSSSGSLYKTFHNRFPVTKKFRSFSHLIIDSFPEKADGLSDLLTFLDLIGVEIKNLKIRDISNALDINTFYTKVPNIEALEIEGGEFLTYLPIDTKVKTIKMLSPLNDLKALIRCRQIEMIESLDLFELEITKEDLNNNDIYSFMGTNVIRALKPILGDYPNGEMSLKSNFNYCGEDKMSLKDVEEIGITNGKTILSSNTFGHFKNLKNLSFNNWSDNSSILITRRANYSGITHLSLRGFSKPTPNFIKLLQSFPDVQELDIGFAIDDSEFLTICGHMPKLREFLAASSMISVRGLLAEDKHSLKDLKFLRSLVIQTNDEIMNVSDLKWPSLPNLRQLILSGQGLKPLNQNFYLQMARGSPRITHLSISYANYQGFFHDLTKFTPLLKHLKLICLTLPGEYNDADVEEPNSSLITIIVHHCKTLQALTLEDINGFCLSQELLLFKSLPTLKTVCSIIGNSPGNWYESQFRSMTRTDSEKIKPYLKENLHKYKKLNETIDYIIDNIMPGDQYVNLCESFNSKFGEDENESQKDLYIVACEFLEMNSYELCKIVEFMRRFNSLAD